MCPRNLLLLNGSSKASQTLLASSGDEGFDFAWSVTPSEAFSGARNRVFPYTCAIKPNTKAKVVAQLTGAQYAGAYNAVTRDPDELFVLNGVTGGDGANVVKINATDMSVLWSVKLINTTETNEWNYPGVIAVDRARNVLVVYGYRLAVLDGDSGTVTKTVELPTIGIPKADTTFNGFNILSDGTLIMKNVFRAANCTVQGFLAFSECPSTANSTLVLVNGTTFEVVSYKMLPAGYYGRITSGMYNGMEYVYLGTTTSVIYRWIYKSGAVTLDPTWGPVAAVPSNTLMQATSAIAMLGDWVVTATNGDFSVVPMQTIAINQRNSSIIFKERPFVGLTYGRLNMTAAEAIANKYILSWAASALPADPASMIFYPYDFAVGYVSAYTVSEKGLKKLWQVPQRTSNFLQLMGPEYNRMLVGSNVPELHGIPPFSDYMSYTTEVLQFRSAKTGQLLAATGNVGPALAIPSTPGFGGDYFWLSSSNESNYAITKVTYTPDRY